MASTSVRRKRKTRRYISARTAAFRTAVVGDLALLTLGMAPLPSWEKDIHLSAHRLPTSARFVCEVGRDAETCIYGDAIVVASPESQPIVIRHGRAAPLLLPDQSEERAHHDL